MIDFSVSPVALLAFWLFVLILAAVSVVTVGRYFSLYLEHRDLEGVHREAALELSRLRRQFEYQSAVADDYLEIMNALGRIEAQDGPETAEASEAAPENGEFIASGALEALAAQVGSEGGRPPAEPADGRLAAWADFFPGPAFPPEQELEIENLRINGGHFRFQLLNEGAGRQAQGRLLLLFAVEEADGQISLRPYPDFDPQSPRPDFEAGPAYNIRSSKPVSGQLELNGGDRVLEMMVIARSRAGNVVLKKKISPDS
ncbi:MAG: hypothetical protein LBP33_11215 [Candidatus Adiutrix sp.]|nr:hypothetical protein [Candidatus Adiutrix sp.]